MSGPTSTGVVPGAALRKAVARAGPVIAPPADGVTWASDQVNPAPHRD